jgi:hypothetical protein
MNTKSHFSAYCEGMSFFPPTGMEALRDEFAELVEDKSIEEVFDVLHTLCRMVKMPNIITYIIAYPTAKKHALRVLSYGCPRSRRNCEKAGDLCICKK